MKLYPSLMCVDFSKLDSEIKKLDNSGITGYHIDIMDGNFVPNFALGSNDIKAVFALSEREIDVHLMVSNIDNSLSCFLNLPADRICFHYEACVHHHRALSQIRSSGKLAGIAINPGTSIACIEDLLSELDFVLIMTVNPGFAGQKFIDAVTEKIEKLAKIRNEKNLSFEIEVDGSTSPDKIEMLSKIGVESFVLGTAALFNKGREYTDIVNELYALEK